MRLTQLIVTRSRPQLFVRARRYRAILTRPLVSPAYDGPIDEPTGERPERGRCQSDGQSYEREGKGDLTAVEARRAQSCDAVHGEDTDEADPGTDKRTDSRSSHEYAERRIPRNSLILAKNALRCRVLWLILAAAPTRSGHGRTR